MRESSRCMKSFAIALGTALVSFVVLASIVEAARRRGIDPIGRIAAVLSPAPAQALVTTGVAQ